MAKSLFTVRRNRASTNANDNDNKVQILTYHGRPFVTGLLWQPLGSLTGYMKEARQFGRQEQMDIVAIRHTESVIQAGFVSRTAGAIKGMYSLASTLAGQLGSSWMAAWKLGAEDDRYVMVAVYRGAVIPGADLVGTRDEIERKVAQQLGRSIVFEKLFLPPEFDRGGEPFDVEPLLLPAQLKREYKLRPLAFGLSTNELMKLGVVGALLTLAFVGWQQWQAHQLQLAHQAAMAAEAKRKLELEALNQRTKAPQGIQALQHPWAKQPSVAAFLEGCNGAIDRLPLSIAGWLFTSAQCDGKLLSANYDRTGNSTTAAFTAATSGHFADTPAFFDEGNRAGLKLTFELPLAGDDTLRAKNIVLAEVTSWLQAQTLAPHIKEIPDVMPQPEPLPGQPAPSPPPAPDYQHFEIQYTSLLPPASVLHDIPSTGLRLREIKTQLQNDQLTWSVTGDLYAK